MANKKMSPSYSMVITVLKLLQLFLSTQDLLKIGPIDNSSWIRKGPKAKGPP